MKSKSRKKARKLEGGQIYSAIRLEAYVGRIAVCAEAIALGVAAKEGPFEIEEIVAVYRNGRVVAPCGMCREMISDFGANARAPGPENLTPSARQPTMKVTG